MGNVNDVRSLLGLYEKIIKDVDTLNSLSLDQEVKQIAKENLHKRCVETKTQLIKELELLPVILEEENVKTQKMSIINKADEYKEWIQSTANKVDDIYCRNLIYTTGKEVLKEIYEYMTNVYGIVWEQEFKEWKRENTGFPRTLRIIYDNKQYLSIFNSILEDRVQESMGNKVVTINEIIDPLLVKYNDKSGGGAATLRKIHSHMTNVYNENWEKLEKKYEKAVGTHALNKLQLVKWNHGTTERFRQSVRDLMIK